MAVYFLPANNVAAQEKVANAGEDQIICISSTVMSATPPQAGESGMWAVISGTATIVSPNLYNTEVTNISYGNVELVWIITPSTGLPSSDAVTIMNKTVSIPNAGEDQVVTNDFAELSANVPINGQGSWAVVSPQNLQSFDDDSHPNTTVRNLSPNENILSWSISNEYCFSYDNVAITYQAASNAETITLTFDGIETDSYQSGCGFSWIEKGVTNVLDFNNESCDYNINSGQVSLHPAAINLNIGELPGELSSIEIDIIDYCGEGCTVAKLYQDDVVISEASNIITYEPSTLILQPSGEKLDANLITISSYEGMVLEVRINMEVSEAWIFPEFTFTRSETNGNLYYFNDVSTALKTTINSWAWDIHNDGTTDAESSYYEYTFENEGQVEVKLTVSDGALTQEVFHTIQTCDLVIENYETNPQSPQQEDGAAYIYFTGGNEPYEFLWNNGATTQNIENVPAGDYTITITDVNNCTATAEITIPGPPPCELTLITDISTYGKMAYFSTTVTGSSDYTVLWNFGDGQSGMGTYANHNYADYQTYNVCATVNDNIVPNCSITECYSVAICPTQATFQSEGVDCQTFKFTDNTTNDSQTTYSILWNMGDGTTYDGTNYDQNNSFMHTYQNSGDYEITLTITNLDMPDCVSTETTTVKVMPLTGTFSTEQNLNRVSLSTDIQGQNYGLQWNMGDGYSFFNLHHFEYVYLEPGTYEITLTGTANYNYNCQFSQTQSVAINEMSNCGLVAYYNMTPSYENCNTYNFNGYVAINGEYTEAVDYEWDMGDGTIYTENLYFNHTYSEPGAYDVCFTVTEQANPNCSVTYCEKIYHFPPTVNFSYTYSSNNLVQFNGTLDNVPENFTFEWNFGDGSYNNETLNPSHEYADNGEYEVCLNIYTQGKYKMGCNPYKCKTVIITDVPYVKADFTMTDNFGFAPFEVSFFDESLALNTEITSWEWDFNNDQIIDATIQNPVFTYTTPGLYNPTLTISDGNIQNSFSRQIEILNCIVGDFTYDNYDNCYEFNFYPTVMNQSGRFSLSWKINGVQVSNSVDGFTHLFDQNNASIYNICMRATDSQNPTCFIEACKQIAIAPMPVNFDYIINSNFVKFNSIIPLTFETDVNWNFGDENFGYGINTEHSYQEIGNYNACMKVTIYAENQISGACMLPPVCKPITINTISDCDLKAYFSYSINEELSQLNLNNKSTGTITDYQWWVNGDYYYETNPVIPIQLDIAYDVCLTIFNNENGCQDEVCQTIYPPQVSCYANFNFTTTPGSLEVVFQNGSVGGAIYEWYFGDGYYSNEENPVHIYAEPNVYEVGLSIQNEETECYASYFAIIQIGTVDCFADFSYFNQQETNEVYFYDNSLGNITLWDWNFGDGNVSNEQYPLHTYSEQGTYTVTLSIENSQTECSSTITKEVVVGQEECNADFSFFRQPGTGTVQFTNQSTGSFDQLFWWFGDNTYSTETNPSHTYLYNDSYDVYLDIWNSEGNCYSTKYKQVIVQGAQEIYCNADFTHTINHQNLSINLSSTTTGAATFFEWYFDDGTYKTGQNISHTFENSGMHEVYLYTYDDASGCFSSAYREFVVGSINCKAQFETYINPDDLTVQINNQSTGNQLSYYWNFGNGETSTSENPVITYSEPGIYWIDLSIENAANNCSDWTYKQIIVGNTNCVADFVAVPNGQTNTISFENRSQGGYYYSWWFDDGEMSWDENVSHTFETPGRHYVELFIVNEFGTCWDLAWKEITVGEIPCSADFTIFYDQTTNTLYTYSSAVGQVDSYWWQFGDGNYSDQPNASHQYTDIDGNPANGYYWVSLTTYSSSGCSDYQEKRILVGSEGLDCQAAFHAQINVNQVNFFNDSQGDGLTYEWTFDDYTQENGGTSSLENPSYTYTYEGYHNVCLTIENSQGIRNTKCEWIQTGASCLAGYIYFVTPGTLSVNMQQNSYGGADYFEWNMGDGTILNESSINHTYAQPNYYDVTLTAVNTVTNCVSTYYDRIIVGVEDPTLTATIFGVDVLPTNGKPGHTVRIQGGNSGTAASQRWSYGDRSTGSGTLTPIHTYATLGTYNACLVVFDPITGVESQPACTLITPEILVGLQQPNLEPQGLALSLYPNPANEKAYITFSVTSISNVSIEIFDTFGKTVEQIQPNIQNTGKHTIELNTNKLVNGVYFIQLRQADKTVSQKFVVIK